MILQQCLFEHWRWHVTPHVDYILRLCKFLLHRFGNSGWPIAIHSVRIKLKKKRTSKITSSAIGDGRVLRTDYALVQFLRLSDSRWIPFIAAAEEEQC